MLFYMIDVYLAMYVEFVYSIEASLIQYIILEKNYKFIKYIQKIY